MAIIIRGSFASKGAVESKESGGVGASEVNTLVGRPSASKVPMGKRLLSPSDEERTVGALRRTVAAEKAFRDTVDSAEPGNTTKAVTTFEQVPHRALKESRDPMEQAALITQLDQTMGFHEDRLRTKAYIDHVEEVIRLRDERAKGLINDAGDAAAMAVGAQGQLRAMFHLQNLLQSAEQTVLAAGQSSGESTEATDNVVAVTRSAMLGAFTSRLAASDPEQALLVLDQVSAGMEKADVSSAQSAISQGRQGQVFAMLEAETTADDIPDYDAALQQLASMGHVSLGLTVEEAESVHKRLSSVKARREYEQQKADLAKRQETYDTFYAHVEAGDVISAQKLLQGDTSLSASQRNRMVDSLTHSEWKTDPKSYMKLLKSLSGGGKGIALHDVVPGKSLSQRDATLIRDVLGRDDPRSVVENRLLERAITGVTQAMEDEKYGDRAAAARALFQSVADARKKGKNPVLLLQTGTKESMYDVLVATYGHTDL